ncbi:lipid A export permease/ATP-binding protein MsbA [Rhodoferax sp.]|uniref:lipid A export permease/ATP-binding protein MsbA n=1 Tax=Rhodoferax sp. TaxID=50421 RepID=UPI002728334D|nr:lipid A export permease/ATP-binding protein MsbA [Rhodoferax sp.]MDO9198375.1 lipid A export permease/ATP-binding protein MsbA [Rhodoferax sp.]
MTKPITPSNRDLYARLLSYVRPYWKAFALAVIGMVGTAATEPVFPAIMKYLLDKGFKTEDPRMVWLIPAGIVALFLVRSIFVYCTGYLMMWISSRLVTDLRRDMFAKLLVLPTHHYDEHSAGQLISRLVYDVNNVTDAATSALISVVRESLTALALIGYLLYLDWKLTLITLAIGPVIAFTVKSFSKRMRAASQKSLTAMRLISHTIEETISAERVVKIFGGQTRQQQRFFEATEQFRRAQMREAIPASAVTPITHIAASVAIAVIAFLALSQSTGEAGSSAGGFIAFITAMLLLISPIKQLTTVNTTIQRGLAASESVFALLDTPQEDDQGQQQLLRVKGEICFDNVSFRYPGAERMALNGINFRILAGQTVALVGASGGGKTTISSLIPRFYPLTSGQILVDGTDIQNITLANLRENIALVSQDVVLFNDTVEANIAYGSLETFSREEVIKAARAANAWDFIEQLPNGLDTPIGENGAKLSGGQRQRLAIARALLKNAPILILDEATSALDTESERQVQAALAVLMKNRTTLVIAHRLSTIEHADVILVVDQGRIVETGTHTELVRADGYYANLCRLQT